MGPFHSVNVYQAFSLFCFYCSFDFRCLKYSPLTVFPWSQTQMSPMFEAFFNCLFTLNSWALHSPFTKILYHLLYTGWFNTRLKNSSCAISLKSPSLRVGLFLFIFLFFCSALNLLVAQENTMFNLKITLLFLVLQHLTEPQHTLKIDHIFPWQTIYDLHFQWVQRWWNCDRTCDYLMDSEWTY